MQENSLVTTVYIRDVGIIEHIPLTRECIIDFYGICQALLPSYRAVLLSVGTFLRMQQPRRLMDAFEHKMSHHSARAGLHQ